MKLHLDPANGSHVITQHGAGFVVIDGIRVTEHVIILPDVIINPWRIGSVTFTATSLCVDDFAAIFERRPELVVFGAGAVFRFPERRILAAFAEARIGFEVMDTPAACRTYNVLVSEGRRIAAALLIG